MQHWSPTFKPSTTSISIVPVWVRLPNLPLHLWNAPSLRAIGNAIGQFHNICHNTTKFFKMTYARICVQMDLSTWLLAELNIINQDYSWNQALDYENVSFRCRTCNGIGHLAKSFPKATQTYRNLKATWWTGAHPEHYTVSNDESDIQHDGTNEFPKENLPGAILTNRDPQDEELPLGTSKAILETMATTPRKENPPFPKISYTTTSPEFSDWKQVTKKFPGAATFPRGSEGHKGIQ